MTRHRSGGTHGRFPRRRKIPSKESNQLKGENENVNTTETTSLKKRSGCYYRPHSSGRARSYCKVGRLRASSQRRGLAHLHRVAWSNCNRACRRAAIRSKHRSVSLVARRELQRHGRPVVLLARKLRC